MEVLQLGATPGSSNYGGSWLDQMDLSCDLALGTSSHSQAQRFPAGVINATPKSSDYGGSWLDHVDLTDDLDHEMQSHPETDYSGSFLDCLGSGDFDGSTLTPSLNPKYLML
jgi:hypothetical protein